MKAVEADKLRSHFLCLYMFRFERVLCDGTVGARPVLPEGVNCF